MKTVASTLALLGALLGVLPGAIGPTAAAGPDHEADGHHGPRSSRHERYLYVAAIAQSEADPDFVTVVGTVPRRKDFGKIVNRIDMPNMGDQDHAR